jgi:hypothetical protein
VRFVLSLVPLGTALFGLLFGAAHGLSCILAERDSDGGADATGPTEPEESGEFEGLDGCACCGKSILPLLPICAGHAAFTVPAGDCPKGCTASIAYILCDGVCYSDCACTLPVGYSIVDGGS